MPKAPKRHHTTPAAAALAAVLLALAPPALAQTGGSSGGSSSGGTPRGVGSAGSAGSVGGGIGSPGSVGGGIGSPGTSGNVGTAPGMTAPGVVGAPGTGIGANGTAAGTVGTPQGAPITTPNTMIGGNPARVGPAPGQNGENSAAAIQGGSQNNGQTVLQSPGISGSAGEAAARGADPRCEEVLAHKDYFTANVVQACQNQAAAQGRQTGPTLGQREPATTGTLGAGVKPVDRPSEVQKNLEPSDNKAVRSLCTTANCQ
jgi:hypothetical protein